MTSAGIYSFTCCVCAQAKRITLGVIGRSRAREALQTNHEWASTSMELPTGKDICKPCLDKWIVSHGSSFPFMRLVRR